jgi:hypothetical protein
VWITTIIEKGTGGKKPGLHEAAELFVAHEERD